MWVQGGSDCVASWWSPAFFPNYLLPWRDHWYSFAFRFYIEVNMYHIQSHNEDWNPKVYVPGKTNSMRTVTGSSMTGATKYRTRRSELWRQHAAHNIGQDIRWYMMVYDSYTYAELWRQSAAHNIGQDSRWYMMVYDSYTYPEPRSITFIASESLYTIVHNVIHHGRKKEHGSQHKDTTLNLDLDGWSSNVGWGYSPTTKQ